MTTIAMICFSRGERTGFASACRKWIGTASRPAQTASTVGANWVEIPSSATKPLAPAATASRIARGRNGADVEAVPFCLLSEGVRDRARRNDADTQAGSARAAVRETARHRSNGTQAPPETHLAVRLVGRAGPSRDHEAGERVRLDSPTSLPVNDRNLKVWRLHPQSCPIVPAEKTLHGTANRAAVRWCGPFTHANR